MEALISKSENTIKNKLLFIPSKLSKCSTYENDQYFICKSPFKTSMFNIVWIKGIMQESIENELSKIVNIFNPLPFALWIGPNTFPTIPEKIFNNLGFVKEANEIGMHFDLKFLKVSDISYNSLSIIEVKNEQDMLKFISVLEVYDPLVRDYYLNVLNEINSNSQPFRFFCLILEEKPVCIASLFFYKNYCGIFDVLTGESFQKKGYAFKLMIFLMNYAKNYGSSHIFLTASSHAALSLYTKLGFARLGNYECYEYKR
ncbi:GNAT family N-acetyltransferase [Pigmentibacter sp. JX0631]|uniref:GNAT family N-acetyltransferase n=1 Tax=Pigmentibacter sp. JX0631 TaxID=2976982 RepID=UPI002469BB1C|nr:GNAT family N-acetyltransferase [Pigmentibacter sp. JX0631]WGL60497.1 GNAT family N-acetyltransferase [Pigmentibacter sp. JX0631]